MSLRVALSSATSGLMVAQSATAVSAGNVANADIEGYTRKTAERETRAVGGAASGVRIADVGSSVDRYLTDSINRSASDLGYSDARAGYLDRMQRSYGAVSGEASLSTALSELSTGLEALAVTPESLSEKNVTVERAERVAVKLRDLSQTTQRQRQEADIEIAQAVDGINGSLRRIDDLNRQIARDQALGRPTADLEDQRRIETEAIAWQMDIRYYVDGNNQQRIYTGAGRPLLDSTVHELSHQSLPSVDSSIAYTPGGGAQSFDGIMLDGADITQEIGSGWVKGLVEVRDVDLPGQQAQLDALAGGLMDAVNAAHNGGTAYPPPQQLTGTRSVAGGDAFAGSGSLRVAVVDGMGQCQTTTDIDLSTLATVGDVATALDAVPGVTAGIDAEGRLFVAADDPTKGIALGETASAVGPDSEGFSNYFGLNDLFVGSGAADVAVRGDIRAEPGRLATGRLSDSPILSPGDRGLTSGDSSVAQAMAAALDSPRSFPSAGNLGARTVSVEDYSTDLVANTANAAAAATSERDERHFVHNDLKNTFSARTGVNIDEETAEMAALEGAYSASASVVRTLQEMFDSLLKMVN